ncbi:hypothetical protein FQN53_004025 [Emmonsiellopsis sp. PD_33]|nr:hypothetical protein FQN53_004025 [Emmonsiellopsis sp. PD_33]
MVWNACDLQWSPHGNSEIDPSEKEEIVKRFELNAPKAVWDRCQEMPNRIVMRCEAGARTNFQANEEFI